MQPNIIQISTFEGDYRGAVAKIFGLSDDATVYQWVPSQNDKTVYEWQIYHPQ